MNKYLLISPYFGKLPPTFQKWLNSCKTNDFIDFIVITDDKSQYELPENVRIEYMSFDELKTIIQAKFDFKVNLPSPYKLCDFKPSFSYIFDKYTSGYEYCGNCDLDLIFGDLSKFLPEEKYDKISYLGHVTFYKNDDSIKNAFKKQSSSKVTYKEIFSNDANFGFDEVWKYGINRIFLENNLSIFSFEKYAADFTTITENLRLSHFISEDYSFNVDDFETIFTQKNGQIVGWYVKDGRLLSKEFAYAHFQKRKMVDYRDVKDSDYIIGPHGFYPYEEMSIEILNRFHGKDMGMERFKRRYKAYKNSLYRRIQLFKICNRR